MTESLFEKPAPEDHFFNGVSDPALAEKNNQKKLQAPAVEEKISTKPGLSEDQLAARAREHAEAVLMRGPERF